MTMAVVEVYPDELSWADSVPCTTTGNKRYIPKPELPAPFNMKGTVPISFINEARTRFGRYEVPMYSASSLKNYHDDGPASLDQIVEACRLIEEGLKSKRGQVVVYVPKIPEQAPHRSFSALCVAAHRVLARGATAQEAAKPWQSSEDGTTGINFYGYSWAPKKFPPPARSLSMEHCLEALEAARDKGWLSLSSFHTRSYLMNLRMYDTVWFVPGKVQVLGDPMGTIKCEDPGTANEFTTADGDDEDAEIKFGKRLTFTTYFKKNKVSLLVRLNYPNEDGVGGGYDPNAIKRHGISLMDSPFTELDGAVPSSSTLARVLRRCEKEARGHDPEDEPGIAFHCNSGFSRSVTMASAWMAYHYDIPGTAAVAWSRLCRPGAVTSHKQAEYLKSLKGRRGVEEILASAGCCSVQ